VNLRSFFIYETFLGKILLTKRIYFAIIVSNDTIFKKEGERLTASQQNLLFSLPLFTTLRIEDKNALLDEKQYVVHQVKAGEVITSLPNYHNSLCVILDGSAIVQNEKGEAACLRVLSSGSIFGVATLFSQECNVSTVTAKSACNVCFIEKSWVESRIRCNSNFAFAYIHFLSNRICFLNQRITAFTAPSATQRLKSHLTSLCEGVYPKEITVNAVQLAAMLNVSRISLYRAFDALQEEGIIQKQGKTITILKK
jgi:CRP-like cAMP-binding protein